MIEEVTFVLTTDTDISVELVQPDIFTLIPSDQITIRLIIKDVYVVQER